MTSNQNAGFMLTGIKNMPLQVPIEILAAQPELGVHAVLLWINLLLFVEKHQALSISFLAEAMGLEVSEVNRSLVKLADHGWINDEGYEIKLSVPSSQPASLPSIPADTPAPSHSSEDVLDKNQQGFEWLITCWSNRVSPPSPEEMKKLMFWMEKKQMSHEVIAVAIEEMCAAIDNPHFAYVEGILRNWSNEGVHSYTQLLEKPYLTKVLAPQSQSAVSLDATKKWKELFPDEFDDEV